VRRFVVISALLTGCFYVDPINQRPSLVIIPASSDAVFRGSNVVLHAEVDDPEGDEAATEVLWQAFLCTDATDRDTCDMIAPFYTGATRDANFVVPAVRADGHTPVQSVLVTLDATDPGGARAKPPGELVIPVSNSPPDLLPLRPVNRHNYVVGTPIDIFAEYGDFDDGAAKVTLDWQVVTPRVGSTYAPLVDIYPMPQPDPNKLGYVTVGKTLVPANDPANNVGEWKVQVTATDPLGAQTPQMVTLNVAPDHPACIAQVSPIVPPPGVTLPVFDPTLFQVLVVIDDLDVFPPQPSDGVLGVTTFKWSIKPPGASGFQPFGTASAVDFDPSTLRPGDIVEIRVEVADRTTTFPNCPDDTCALDATRPDCIQRQTWHVEVQ